MFFHKKSANKYNMSSNLDYNENLIYGFRDIKTLKLQIKNIHIKNIHYTLKTLYTLYLISSFCVYESTWEFFCPIFEAGYF